MIRVKNQKAVAKLSKKSLQANRVRNTVAVFAIALTTMMFMALFTISGTMVHTFQQESFRQVGTYGHGSFKDLTLEQKELLEKDPLIKEAGGRLTLGVGSGEHFRKIQAELSYMEPAYAKMVFCEPSQGRLPKEGTKEIACDTRILQYIGVQPEIGAEVAITYQLDNMEGTELTDTFVLSGWWEYDPAASSSMAVLPRTYVEEIISRYPKAEDDTSTMGTWTLELMFDSSMHIERDILQVLENHGYQSDDATADGYIPVGVNWAYAGAQLAANADFVTIVEAVIMLLLIIFTGYLIIYNIFQISVSADIRFYGLLKTIGTTGRQIRHMIRRQALVLAVIGIPLGLAAGYAAGIALAPVIMSTYSVGKAYLITSPWFFAAASVFALVTVLISCAKPGRIASRVSPIEAVRYTDADSGSRRRKRRSAGGKTICMAFANLGRNKKKTVLVVLSMTLAVVLMQLTYTLARGFDMDKYLKKWVVSDFILGDAYYFHHYSADYSAPFPAVPEEDIQKIDGTGKVTESGRIYGHQLNIFSYVTKEAYRDFFSLWQQEEEINEMIDLLEKDDAGRVNTDIKLYGMEDYPLSQLNVVDGDLSDLYDPDKRAIAAVYLADDYDKPMEKTQWAKVGDQVTVHYVYEWEYYDDATGKKISKEEARNLQRPYTAKEKEAADITYEVAACVMIKNAMSYRYAGALEYVMNAQTFQRDSRTSDVMTYLFNTAPEDNEFMEDYLYDYTNDTNLNLDYESKQNYVEQYQEYCSMYLVVGSALSFVVGMVGILNFFNAVLTSINARRREFAMLQSIGMTGRQLKKMLICEGVIYGVAAVAVSALVSCLIAPFTDRVAGSVFWFFTYRFTILPVIAVFPVFAVLGVLLPLVCYRSVAGQTIVERLRESE